MITGILFFVIFQDVGDFVLFVLRYIRFRSGQVVEGFSEQSLGQVATYTAAMVDLTLVNILGEKFLL